MEINRIQAERNLLGTIFIVGESGEHCSGWLDRIRQEVYPSDFALKIHRFIFERIIQGSVTRDQFLSTLPANHRVDRAFLNGLVDGAPERFHSEGGVDHWAGRVWTFATGVSDDYFESKGFFVDRDGKYGDFTE